MRIAGNATGRPVVGRPVMPSVGALQNVVSMPQFRLETALGRVYVALRQNSYLRENGAMWRRGKSGEV